MTLLTLLILAVCRTHIYEFFSGCVFNCVFNISIFIYFTIIGYITNSQLTIYSCGLVAQWIEYCAGFARSWIKTQVRTEQINSDEKLFLLNHSKDDIGPTSGSPFEKYNMKKKCELCPNSTGYREFFLDFS